MAVDLCPFQTASRPGGERFQPAGESRLAKLGIAAWVTGSCSDSRPTPGYRWGAKTVLDQTERARRPLESRSIP
jgi:hypothetical protein